MSSATPASTTPAATSRPEGPINESVQKRQTSRFWPDRFDIHPLLAAAVVVLSLGARNVRWLTGVDVLVVLGPVLLFVAIGFLLVLLLRREPRRAALVSTWLTIAAFYYGVLFDELEKLPLADGLAIRHGILIAIVAGISAILWTLPGNLTQLAKFITVTSGIASILFSNSLIQAFLKEPKSTWKESLAKSTSDTPASTQDSAIEKPDIYYIILDAYGRKDVLKHYYQFDNSEFLDGLTEKGFYIADRACANYPGTAFSLPSALNMRYHEPVNPYSGIKSLAEMVRTNEVMLRLKQNGYKIIHFNTRWIATACSDIAHVSMGEQTPIPGGARMLWLHLIEHGAMRFIRGGDRAYFAAQHRRAFEDLGKVPALPGPKFTFVHIIAPHPPFVFEKDGNTNWNIDQEERSAYSNQVVAINNHVKKAVDTILAESKTPPVIIIQSDHGPGYFKTIPTEDNPSTNQYAQERMPILSTYLVPDSVRKRLYPTISPVNSFRVLLSELFGYDYPLLPERHFLFHSDGWATYEEVTDQIHDGIPAPDLKKIKFKK